MIDKSIILNGGKYFSSGIFQNYLVFIPAIKYIKYFTGTTRIESWKSNGMLQESVENITKLDSNFAPTFVDHLLLPDMNFNGHCLLKNNISIPMFLSIYFIRPVIYTDFTLGNCLFGSVKLTKNTDLDKQKYTGYNIGFDSRSEFLFTDGS